jgi:hypothetical protein
VGTFRALGNVSAEADKNDIIDSRAIVSEDSFNVIFARSINENGVGFAKDSGEGNRVKVHGILLL